MVEREFRKTSETLPAVRHLLMRKEQAEYCMAWHGVIGDRKKVIYNGMGPDISSVLLFTNATEITGVDTKGFYNDHTEEYITKYWDFLNTKPIWRAGAFGYASQTPENLKLDHHEWKLFYDHRRNRLLKGYWDYGAVNHWDIDRLLMLEFKKMDVEKEMIKIKRITGGVTEIGFDWAYPGESVKPRKLIYVWDDLGALTRGRKLKHFIRNADCFYQKSVPVENYETLNYLKMILPYLGKDAVVAISYIFKDWGDNKIYKKELADALGQEFNPLGLDGVYDEMIDNLPEEDVKADMNKYGMKLHVFGRIS